MVPMVAKVTTMDGGLPTMTKQPDIEIGTVIDRTYSPLALTMAFVDELQRIDTDNEYSMLRIDARAIIGSLRGDNVSDETIEQASYIISELFDALNACGPQDMYFGANDSDGCDYGWWATDND